MSSPEVAPLSQEERAWNERQSLASARLDGGEVTPETLADSAEYVAGVIDAEGLLARVKKRYGVGGPAER